MYTRPKSADDTSTNSLDHTDVLPVLDVEAYEETLVEKSKSLSRTDTWTVEALRDIDELVDSATHEGPVEVRSINVNREGPAAEALTVNVDRILKRIGDLEGDIVMAHDANAVLQKRNENLQIERDQYSARLEALNSEHARLGEHRTLAEEMAQRTEKQLRADVQRLETQVKELNDGHAKSLALAERAINGEKSNSSELARRFAAKLTEHDKLVSSIEQRNRTIDEIVSVRDDLDQRLRRELVAGTELKTKLAVSEEAMGANRALLLEREATLADGTRRQAELTAKISELSKSLQVAERSSQDAHREVTVAAKARGDEERRHAESEAKLREAMGDVEAKLRGNVTELESRLRDTLAASEAALRDTVAASEAKLSETVAASEAQLRNVTAKHDALLAERDAAQTQILALTAERDGMRPAAAELGARTAELERTVATVTKLRGELASAQTDAQASEQLAQERADELVALREKLEDYAAAIRRVEDDVQTQEQVVEGLRVQLQTAHEECSIMQDQREKARARAKQLTQEIFRRDHKIDELEADLAVHSEALAAIRRDVNRIGEKSAPAVAEDVEWILDPIEHAGEVLRLTGSMLTIGRTAESDIALPSKMISRNHARLLIGPNGIIVEDAGSTNGCFVNGEQVRQHLMHDGDVLELGDLRYRLRIRPLRETAVRANVVSLFEQSAD